MRRAALVAVVALALIPAGAVAAKQRTSMSAVLPYFMCVTCHIPLELAQSPQADAERNYIQQLIDEGDTFAQIKRSLVAEYGDEVLALPPARGFDLTVYIVPIAVVLAMLGLLSLLLPRWRRNLRGSAGAGAATPPPLSAADAARLDDELRRHE